MAGVNQVLLVGHCGPDSWMLKSYVQTVLPGRPVLMVNDAAQLQNQASRETLLLVNRVLDGSFPSDSGIDLIGELAKQPDAPPTMLISNYADAQEQAVRAGAKPGFGKSQIGTAETAARLRQAAGVEQPKAAS